MKSYLQNALTLPGIVNSTQDIYIINNSKCILFNLGPFWADTYKIDMISNLMIQINSHLLSAFMVIIRVWTPLTYPLYFS